MLGVTIRLVPDGRPVARTRQAAGGQSHERHGRETVATREGVRKQTGRDHRERAASAVDGRLLAVTST